MAGDGSQGGHGKANLLLGAVRALCRIAPEVWGGQDYGDERGNRRRCGGPVPVLPCPALPCPALPAARIDVRSPVVEGKLEGGSKVQIRYECSLAQRCLTAEPPTPVLGSGGPSGFRTRPFLGWLNVKHAGQRTPSGSTCERPTHTIVPDSYQKHFFPVAWDTQCRQLPPNTRNQCVHWEVPTGTFSQPLWQSPPCFPSSTQPLPTPPPLLALQAPRPRLPSPFPPTFNAFVSTHNPLHVLYRR